MQEEPEQQTASTEVPAEKQLEGFLAKYDPKIAALAEEVLARMRKRLPACLELCYDNYNALAIGFGPTERASDAIFSIAVFPRWVSLFFLQAKGLSDPGKVLRGKGKKARHIVLTAVGELDDPRCVDLMDQALERAAPAFPPGTTHRLIIKSISAKQRPRRPVANDGQAVKSKPAKPKVKLPSSASKKQASRPQRGEPKRRKSG